MAEPLPFTPQAPPFDTKEEELAFLLETLHTSGTLRFLSGFFGKFSEVAGVALDRLNTEAGKNALANLGILLVALGKFDPNQVMDFAQGMAKGMNAAGQTVPEEPPGPLRLLGLLRRSDTRRAAHAMLVLLDALGAHLHPGRPLPPD